MKFRRLLTHVAHRLSLSLMLGLLTLLALASTQPLAASAQSPSFVRVIHASPYVGTADVFLDGAKLLSSFAFGSVTDYAPIPAGPHKVQIALVGKGLGASALTETLAVTPGVAYTVAAIGATATSLSLEVFTDNNQLTPGSAKVRAYHLSPDVGPISFMTGSQTIFSTISYQQASEYKSIAAGAYTFDMQATTVNTTQPISATLKANMVTSIFTVGMYAGNPKLELVSAQVSGLPGVPGTGSDPSVVVAKVLSVAPWLPWLLGAMALVIACGGCASARRETVGR